MNKETMICVDSRPSSPVSSEPPRPVSSEPPGPVASGPLGPIGSGPPRPASNRSSQLSAILCPGESLKVHCTKDFKVKTSASKLLG